MARAAMPSRWARSSIGGEVAAEKPQAGLVDEGGRLERVIRPLAPHGASGDGSEVVVDEGEQLIDGSRVAAPGAREQARDRLGVSHLPIMADPAGGHLGPGRARQGSAGGDRGGRPA